MLRVWMLYSDNIKVLDAKQKKPLYRAVSKQGFVRWEVKHAQSSTSCNFNFRGRGNRCRDVGCGTIDVELAHPLRRDVGLGDAFLEIECGAHGNYDLTRR